MNTSESSANTTSHPPTTPTPSIQTESADVMSPHYIHASDHPGQVYVGELLHHGNYGEWVNDMANALYAKPNLVS